MNTNLSNILLQLISLSFKSKHQQNKSSLNLDNLHINCDDYLIRVKTKIF